MGPCANDVKCGIVEWMKRNILRLFGHEKKNSEEFVKKVYVSEIVSPRRRRSVVRWKDRVKEYMHVNIADRDGGSSAVAIP